MQGVGSYLGDYIGEYVGVNKGDTESLDCRSDEVGNTTEL